MRAKSAVLGVLVLAMTAGYGFWGVSVTGCFADPAGLNSRLTELNRRQPPDGWGGSGRFDYFTPFFWVGAHGGGQYGSATVAGHGALTSLPARADALDALLFGARGGLELGYAWSPLDPLWVRPTLDLEAMNWAHYVHSKEAFTDPDFGRWYYAWTVGVVPALELMGRLKTGYDRYTGVFVQAGWFQPLTGPNWEGDPNPPDFSMAGLFARLGVRFGGYPPFRLRI